MWKGWSSADESISRDLAEYVDDWIGTGRPAEEYITKVIEQAAKVFRVYQRATQNRVGITESQRLEYAAFNLLLDPWTPSDSHFPLTFADMRSSFKSQHSKEYLKQHAGLCLYCLRNDPDHEMCTRCHGVDAPHY